MRVLVSGASIAGPVLAYWLVRYGHEVTVVERAPALRKTGGHAVDLFKPAMDITEKMGVLPHVERLATGTERMTLHRPRAKPIRVNLGKVYQAASDRHVEIMRDDLSEIYYDATTGDVEYLFGDSITEISEDGKVTFENSAPRRFDIVVGADGLHSNVRRLMFGEESEFSEFIGAYLAVITVPKEFGRDGEFTNHLDVGRMAGVYSAKHMDDARAVFLFRSKPLDYHYRDVARQRELLRDAFTRLHPDVNRWVAEAEHSPAFYFDSITQLRMNTWSRGRVTLVGDAGYCPGPAVGGSTSMAVVGAYVLAGELAAAGDDHERGFAAYEREMTEYVLRARKFAMQAARTIIPGGAFGVWALANVSRLVSVLPASFSRALARLNASGARMHDEFPLKDYG
ncbi:FAD-dependent monooxygenase [Kibdelosporangium persicum]|uniref:Membrane-associated oxidoreductase n=1 Tax=Kibdelosporangium persicum TaxID=2698649 RepID=A0ABX2F303_9PSEU|nr:FAD-dependent monooxygenase [Kibdelosporangium persicum]NRN65706.1 Membrane-associated oxidoreductase [Kibdelosporangium persicum]